MKIALFVAVAAGLAASANAQLVASWNLQAAPGNQASQAPAAAAANVTGLAITRGAGLSASAAGNSISSSGWTQQSTDFFSFGFNVGAGFSVNLSSLVIGTRSSSTAPGTLALRYSGDGFTSTLFTFAQTSTVDGSGNPGVGFLNSTINLSSLTGLTGLVEFRIFQVGTGSATGGTSASGGTFRITNFFSSGVDSGDLRFTGTVVPAPGALALVGLSGLVAGRRRRA